MKLGQLVTILPRSHHPGIHRCGGAAFITRIHYDSNDENSESRKPTKIDVKYVLGGKESDIEPEYVLEDASSMSATTVKDKRERKQDVKMNMGELGGDKKRRVALGDVDGNSGRRKRGKKEVNQKKTASTAHELNRGNEENGGLPVGSEMDGEWMFIKSGKISSYLPYLTATTHIQYWWNHEEGWLHATILKSIYKVVTENFIKWVVKVEFEDGVKIGLTFHPGDKRWKIKVGPMDKHKKQEQDLNKSEDMASDKRVKKSAGHPHCKLKNEEKKVLHSWRSNADSGASAVVKSKSRANRGSISSDTAKSTKKTSKPMDLGLFFKNDSADAIGSGGTVNVRKPTDLGLLIKNDTAKASRSGVDLSKHTDSSLLDKRDSARASSSGSTVKMSEPPDVDLSLKDSARASSSGTTVKMRKPMDSSLLVQHDSATASSSGISIIVNTSKPTVFSLLVKNDSARASSSGMTVKMSESSDVDLSLKNDSARANRSSTIVKMSKPTDLGLLVKHDSARASSKDITGITSKHADFGSLVKNDIARASSSGSAVKTVKMSKLTDLGFSVMNDSVRSSVSSSGTANMGKPTEFTLLTKNVSTKSSNSLYDAANESTPTSRNLDNQVTTFKKNTNIGKSSSSKTKPVGKKNTMPCAEKEEPVPSNDNVHKSDKSTVNTITPVSRATKKPSATFNATASFSFPSKTQSKTVTPFPRATQKPSATSTNSASFFFPSKTQIKLKELASKMAKATEESKASSLAERLDGLEAARALAASKKKSHRPHSIIDLTIKPTGQKKLETKTTLKETSTTSSRPMTLTETLYGKESTKAEEFVKHMKRRDDSVARGKERSVHSSPESLSSSASGELVVKVDAPRNELFKAGVYQVMIKLHIDKMDVEELITKVNTYSSSQNQEPFTSLEAKSCLRHLDAQNTICMLWDEGKSGVVYLL